VSGALHHDELRIDPPLVRTLVDRAHPEFAALSLRRLESSGSSNALFRLGDDLLVRLPRQPGGSSTIDKEATWLPVIAPHLPVAVPEILAVGEPGFGYPERWSLVRWLDGSVPSVPEVGVPSEPPRSELAGDLAEVVAAFGAIDVPPDARADPALQWYRGDPLATRDAPTRNAIDACRAISGLTLDLDEVSRVWQDATRLPDARCPSSRGWALRSPQFQPPWRVRRRILRIRRMRFFMVVSSLSSPTLCRCCCQDAGSPGRSRDVALKPQLTVLHSEDFAVRGLSSGRYAPSPTDGSQGCDIGSWAHSR
jgi:Phosphotransferase enzyme family